MADVLVGAVVGVLVEKLFSAGLKQFAESQGIGPQLEEMKKILPLFQAVLSDAGQKEITIKAVKLWLNDLQELAYDIDDVLDDIATQVMKQDIIRSQATKSKLLKMLPTCCTNYSTPHKFSYGRSISSKLDLITSNMKSIYDRKQVLGLVENRIVVDRSDRATTSFVNVSKVLGRDKDKEALIEQLLLGNCSNENVISVVSIVGMGGLGKTTLAQLLYNDERVVDHFEIKAWVCVSDEFDVFSISKQIYQAVVGEDKTFTSLDLLHVALKEKLSNKRFVVVLDDVWNEDHNKWDLLRRAFDVGGHGSKIVVTTRKNEVALVMDSLQPYMLEVLSDEISLSLLAQSSLGEQNFDCHPSLESIAECIVLKCDGLPLALIALGRVLKTRGHNEDEWMELLNSEIWNSDDKVDILPALKLSYYDLPSYLKQLFAYSSLFPKDYEFEKKKLVRLWMAQGFLSQPKGNNQPMEILGGKYFEELLSRSFFQPSTNSESRYIMHDLMNDLATSVAGEFFFRLDENMDLSGNNEAYEKLRHFSFIGQHRDREYKEFKELQRATFLRTFLLVSVGWGRFNTMDNVIAELLTHLHYLRVLSLTNWSITEVPQSIGKLKHLRYLNLSETMIQKIPEEVSELYNLQTLLVSGCHELSSLPVSFVKLINLRHLDMTDTPSLKKFPSGFGGLTSLPTLSKVVIAGGDGFKLSELKDLSDLQGVLSIKELHKVIEPLEAKDANLQQKKGLDDLALVWRSEAFYYSQDPVIEYEVLEKLRPPCKLKNLMISGYAGMKFSSWLVNPTSFDQLTGLLLNRCNNCTELTIEHLTSLRNLEVVQCSKLESIKGEKEVVNIGSLRHVKLSGCDSLKSYCCPTSVEILEIRHCDSMTSLSFSKLMEEDLPSSSSSSSNLNYLSIVDCENIKSISHEHLQSLTSLEVMLITNCPNMEDSFPSCGWLWPPNLKYLKIGELKKPMSEWGLQNYPSSLVDLHLYGYDSGVVSFGIMEGEDHDNTTTCFVLPQSLTSIQIVCFKEVETVSEVLQHLPRLKQLEIINCPHLRDVPQTTSNLRVYVR